MPATKPRSYITPTRFRESPTGIDAVTPVTLGELHDGAARKAWQHVIDETLSEWLRDPSQLDDDGIDPPSGTIIRLAMDWAENFRDKGFPAPDSVAPDPNGGIVFERREGNVSEVVHVWDDWAVEYMRFEGTHLVERSPVEM